MKSNKSIDRTEKIFCTKTIQSVHAEKLNYSTKTKVFTRVYEIFYRLSFYMITL